MDKSGFTALLKRFTKTSAEEATDLVALRDKYPYSQVLHALCARAGKDHALNGHAAWLTLAAVRAADRSVLKEIMTAQDVLVQEETASEPIHATDAPPIRSLEESDIDYADELMRDLATLNTLKHNFEMLLVEYSEVQVSTSPTSDEPPPRKPPRPTGSTKSKRQRMIELAKALNKKNATSKPASPGKKKAKRAVDPPDELIEEIKTTKRELRPENEKQVEQLDLINRFIETQPSISSARDRVPPPTGDLNPIKSGEFGDNIVSETLVQILIKQGKKDKAIEVLKKLIWKYPQKKAYFASQIEDLKK